jgi:hypothetical protein
MMSVNRFCIPRIFFIYFFQNAFGNFTTWQGHLAAPDRTKNNQNWKAQIALEVLPERFNLLYKIYHHNAMDASLFKPGLWFIIRPLCWFTADIKRRAG